MNKQDSLKDFLETKVAFYNQPSFISLDPVSIPHLFTKKQDIEIAGLFAAVFAWGNRLTIIRKSKELMDLMEMQPYEFCINAGKKELARLMNFKHRTFNTTDLLYFVEFFRFHYNQHKSLEKAFTLHGKDIAAMLNGFHHYFFSLPDVPPRTKKHIATPERNSSCKRLNMYLRWMVRQDNNGVDFGLWKNISPSILICPIDLHVARVAKKLGILNRKQSDWQAAVELTAVLSTFDKKDPVKYDFALFSLGVMEKF